MVVIQQTSTTVASASPTLVHTKMLKSAISCMVYGTAVGGAEEGEAEAVGVGVGEACWRKRCRAKGSNRLAHPAVEVR